MKPLKVHLAINKPGGAFAKTACGRALLAGSGGDRVRYPYDYSFGLTEKSVRCKVCDGVYPHWRGRAAKRDLPWQDAAT